MRVVSGRLTVLTYKYLLVQNSTECTLNRGRIMGNNISKYTVREVLNRVLNSAEDGIKITGEGS